VTTKRAFVTGGAGVVGSTIVDQLVKDGGWDVVVFEQFSRGLPENLDWAIANGNVTVVEGDIREAKAVTEAIDGIDVVFHQAAIRVTQCAEDPRLAHEVMVDGTFNVVEAARQSGVGKIVAASSAAVYGMAESLPIAEKHHLYDNRTMYGAAKAYNESLLRCYHDSFGVDYIVLRYFNVYGPRMAIKGPHTEVLVRWMERIAGGQPPLILGDGSDTVDFVYVDDVARANVLAANSDATDEILNVGSGVETSLNDLAVALLKVMRSDMTPEYGPARGVNNVPRRVADTARAKQMIGFQAAVSLEEGLSRLVDWWRGARDPSSS
jgi:UDP-glucose 4-epimerase